MRSFAATEQRAPNQAEMTRWIAVPLLGSFALLFGFVAALVFEPEGSHTIQWIFALLSALSGIVNRALITRRGNQAQPAIEAHHDADLQNMQKKMRLPGIVFMASYILIAILFFGQFWLPDLPWRWSYACNAILLWFFFCKWNIWALITVRYGFDSLRLLSGVVEN